MDQSLIVWLPDGKTLKFEKVTHIKQDADTLSFRYYGISTKTGRSAVFNLEKILGSALSLQP